MHLAITGVTTDKRGRKKKEISAFIVERTTPGFSVGKHEKKMGIKGSSTCELIMEDCIIPKDRLLGKQGKGFGIAMKTLWTAAASASPPRPWVWPRAPSRRPSPAHRRSASKFGRRRLLSSRIHSSSSPG